MDVKYENGNIVITIPCAAADIKAAPTSASGKTRVVATTSGFTGVPGAPKGVKLGLNVTAPLA